MFLVDIEKQFAKAAASESTAFMAAFTIYLSISLDNTIISALQVYT